jgi:hypothetical protein
VERCCVYVTDTSGRKVGRQFAAMDRDGEVISSGLCWRNIRLERGPLSAPQLRMFISSPSYVILPRPGWQCRMSRAAGCSPKHIPSIDVFRSSLEVNWFAVSWARAKNLACEKAFTDAN